MKIVVLDGYAANPDDLSWEPLKEFGELTVYDRTSAADLIKRAQDADMVLTNKCRLKEEELAQLPRLKYIGELATGYNNIDIEYAHSRGIVVSNIPSYSTDSVVQMTFAHIFNITNQVSHYAAEVRAGRWSRNADFCYWDTPLHELAVHSVLWDWDTSACVWHRLHTVWAWTFLPLPQRVKTSCRQVYKRQHSKG